MSEPASAKATTTHPPVAIVLVNWNNWRDCVECIDSLLGMDYPDFHVFIIDNDSRDQSVEKIEAWCLTPTAAADRPSHTNVRRHTALWPDAAIPVRVVNAQAGYVPVPPAGCRVSAIRSGGNLGFAGGCNVGIRSAISASFAYVWLLNTDTVVEQQALTHLIERALRDPSVGMIGSTVLYYDRPHVVQAQAGARMNALTGESRHIGEGIPATSVSNHADEVERDLAYIFGASMLVSRQLIETIGLMQEDYFLYYEEMDWAMRSRAQFKFAYAPRSLVYHKSGSSSSRAMPAFSANLFYRNRIRFISRFFPEHLRATKRGFMQTMLRYVIKGRWTEARIIGRILLQADRIAHEALQPMRVIGS
jgi:GT2 family glycosyltransferase